MVRKVTFIFIFVALAVGYSANTYSAKSDRPRDVISILYFKNGSVELEPAFESDLQKAQAALAVDSAIGLQIEAYGHSQGTPEKNREISQKRAQAVQRWFLEHGIEPSRLIVKSYGDSKTAADKTAPKDPSLNERVEILQVHLPMAYLPAVRHEFASVMEGQEVTHSFAIQNKGSGPLEIQKVKTD